MGRQGRQRQLIRPRLIRGRVLRAGGDPAAGAFVMVAWGTAPTPEIGIVADEAGCFHVALPEGRFRLQANAEEAQGTIELEITPQAPSRAVEIILDG
ncbi:carboxypeptidase-like regulatory domain-containing protein [Sphingosinicella sp. BN140058]|uniref:carboxypeptidase-like regulatory domain-containing protein n=1 Tax=Sphingosinicella sp. BN140058 TaxID=1892855 RepID=UPI0010130365|nr:carboxypeptidase-like regulatory domain-containing protein [Sphingosinicella sp. BN140058]QAY79350.1 carboxypeptidase regulatory-like domain-containing protein [Sphingosinicella sp. BN140058]